MCVYICALANCCILKLECAAVSSTDSFQISLEHAMLLEMGRQPSSMMMYVARTSHDDHMTIM